MTSWRRNSKETLASVANTLALVISKLVLATHWSLSSRSEQHAYMAGNSYRTRRYKIQAREVQEMKQCNHNNDEKLIIGSDNPLHPHPLSPLLSLSEPNCSEETDFPDPLILMTILDYALR